MSTTSALVPVPVPVAVVCLSLMLVLTACQPPNPGAEKLNAACGGKSRHVLAIGIDGVRPDALTTAHTPHIDAVAATGASTLTAFAGGQVGTPTEQATSSGPGWVSILTGVWIDSHGVANNYSPAWDLTATPSFLKQLRQVRPASRLAYLVHWYPLLSVATEADLIRFGSDQQVTDLAVEELASNDPLVVFAHLDDVDGAGHASGYSADSETYVSAIETIDGQIGQMTGALTARPDRDQECWATIVVTDHGGLDRNHGGQSTDERTIPLMVGGDGLITQTIDPGPGLVAVAPTVFAYLDLAPDPAWVAPPFGVPHSTN